MANNDKDRDELLAHKVDKLDQDVEKIHEKLDGIQTLLSRLTLIDERLARLQEVNKESDERILALEKQLAEQKLELLKMQTEASSTKAVMSKLEKIGWGIILAVVGLVVKSATGLSIIGG